MDNQVFECLRHSPIPSFPAGPTGAHAAGSLARTGRRSNAAVDPSPVYKAGPSPTQGSFRRDRSVRASRFPEGTVQAHDIPGLHGPLRDLLPPSLHMREHLMNRTAALLSSMLLFSALPVALTAQCWDCWEGFCIPDSRGSTQCVDGCTISADCCNCPAPPPPAPTPTLVPDNLQLVLELLEATRESAGRTAPGTVLSHSRPTARTNGATIVGLALTGGRVCATPGTHKVSRQAAGVQNK
jgi:hypothetical protein